MTAGNGDEPGSPVRMAVLIMAHAHPEQVGRLVERLSAPFVDIYLHIDRRTESGPFLSALGGRPGCTVLPDRDRVGVLWGGFSVVQAILNLVRTARRGSPAAERFCLLSGADYPARPIHAIAREMAGDVEYIDVEQKLDPKGSRFCDTTIQHHHLGNFRLFNPRTSPSGHLVTWGAMLGGMLPRLRQPATDLYRGSCWWALTRTAIDEILALIARQPGELAWFRKAVVPDELVFPSFVMATSRRDRVWRDPVDRGVLSEPDEGRRLGSHFIRWGGGISPEILTERDHDAILASGAPFIRKVDPAASRALLDALDAAAGRGPADAILSESQGCRPASSRARQAEPGIHNR
ncbi:beta-1,6-N-acetylglucosaminyltransferase [Methylobacterium nonmethylotrophicum]|nr:beta-1,6-N-acetylglucosaminyltransferase [Methylobacterium nonmethylotrophicum]